LRNIQILNHKWHNLALWRNTAGDTVTYTYDPFGKIHTYDTDATDPVYYGQTMLGRTWEYGAAGNPTSHLTRDASGGLINSMEHVNGNWQDPVYCHEGSYVYAQMDTSGAVVQRRQFTASGHLFASESESFWSSDQAVYDPVIPNLRINFDMPSLADLSLVSTSLEANLDVRSINNGFDPEKFVQIGLANGGGSVEPFNLEEGFFPSFGDFDWFTDYIMFPEYTLENPLVWLAIGILVEHYFGDEMEKALDAFDNAVEQGAQAVIDYIANSPPCNPGDPLTNPVENIRNPIYNDEVPKSKIRTNINPIKLPRGTIIDPMPRPKSS
jgi:hypothetical protein